jgi:hypothetical protein
MELHRNEERMFNLVIRRMRLLLRGSATYKVNIQARQRALKTLVTIGAVVPGFVSCGSDSEVISNIELVELVGFRRVLVDVYALGGATSVERGCLRSQFEAFSASFSDPRASPPPPYQCFSAARDDELTRSALVKVLEDVGIDQASTACIARSVDAQVLAEFFGPNIADSGARNDVTSGVDQLASSCGLEAEASAKTGTGFDRWRSGAYDQPIKE